MYEILTESTSCHRRLDVCSLVRHQLTLVVSKLNLPHFKALLMQRDPVFLTLDFSSKLPGAGPMFNSSTTLATSSLSYPKTNPPNYLDEFLLTLLFPNNMVT